MALRFSALVLFIGVAAVWSSTSAAPYNNEELKSLFQTQAVAETSEFKPNFFTRQGLKVLLSLVPDNKKAGLKREFDEADNMKWKKAMDYIEYCMNKFEKAMED